MHAFLAQLMPLFYPLDFANGHCWLAMMPAPELSEKGIRLEGVEPSLSVQHLIASVMGLSLNVTCNNCSSPGT